MSSKKFKVYMLDALEQNNEEFKRFWSNGQIAVHYFEDKSGYVYGEYKEWHTNGILFIHCFYDLDTLHGEYKEVKEDGKLILHCFMINGTMSSIKDMPIPTTNEERMLHKLKYNLPLILDPLC